MPMPLAKNALVASLLLGLALLGGCSTWMSGSFQDPEIRLLRVETIEARLDEQLFRLHFEISNPNSRSLPVRNLSYSLFLNDIPLARNQDERSLIVPGNAVRRFGANLHTNLWRHIREITRLLEKPDQPVQYRLEGTLKAGLLFGRDVRFSRSGEIIPRDHIPE